MIPSISLQDVWVEFPMYQGSSRSLKKSLIKGVLPGNLAMDEADRINVQALRDINLELRDGDRLAILGMNGAGKSTLLKVLSGIYAPARGTMHLAGQVTALLTASVGLDPDATGRENIIIRGMYMDIPPGEMRALVDDIAAFTELGPYIDMPVRTYSSGMMIRLCFAASTCIPAEILIMDEWLSAGDASFLAKAKQRMSGFVGGSNILILASHSMELLREWCNRAIMLDQGRIILDRDVETVIEAYQRRVGILPSLAEEVPAPVA